MEQLPFDAADADTRVEFGMAEAEIAQRTQWRASAEVFRAIDETLREAADHPEVFIEPEMLRGDAVEFAVRAAAADLAVRLSLAEYTVRDQGMIARTLRSQLPRFWAWFAEGDISTQNARAVASIVLELPPALWAEFETKIMAAAHLAPSKFRTRARAVAAKLNAQTLEARHELANASRGVWCEVDRDGMGWLHAHLSAEKLALVQANLDGIAFGLFTETDEKRSMSQLRADVLSDLLGGATAARPATGFTVALTIPALSLLGQSNEPALLEGMGPIDIGTARRICSTVPSFTRLLTDPVSGSILQMDPKQYRVPAALKRWLAIQQATCDFPGCARRAANCDLDHTVAWADGGKTTANNLSHRCRKHHTMKHQTKWRVDRPPEPVGAGAIGVGTTRVGTTSAVISRAVWTSPTGYSREADPPPF